MADQQTVGQNYTTPDLVAKVTGKAKYAEDYRVEGMLFAKLLVSPMPHARVTRLDTSKALAMPGVKAILTADDMPGAAAGATLGEGVQATRAGRTRPDERAALPGRADSRRRGDRRADRAPKRSKRSTSSSSRCPSSSIRLKACGPAARTRARRATSGCGPRRRRRPRARAARQAARGAGRSCRLRQTRRAECAGRRSTSGTAHRRSSGAAAGAAGAADGAPAPVRGQAADAGRGGRGRGGAPAPPPPQIAVWKWTDEDFTNAGEGQMPLGKATDEWTFGNIEEAFKKADLVLDETFMTQSTGHQPLETRTAMAYWQNGKLYLHGSTQSTVQTVASVARWIGVTPDKVVIISEYTGGGFGSKIPGAIFDGDSGAALEESQRAGDDAHHARRRALHRPRAPGHPRAREDGLPQGRPHHRDRHVHGLRQRPVRRAGRRAVRRARRCRSPISRKRCAGAA